MTTPQWNPELVAKLEAERTQRTRPWWLIRPGTPAEIAELVSAVAETDREGHIRKKHARL